MSTNQKTLAAGALRHRISIEQQQHSQDPITGAVSASWVEVVQNLPAAVEPLSGREYIAAAQVKSTITARVTIRYRAGITAAMRIKHGAETYAIRAVLPDSNSGREWLSLMVESA